MAAILMLQIPESERVDTMTKIKSAGTAGTVSYALTEVSAKCQVHILWRQAVLSYFCVCN
jgi:hypothetical protein